MDKARVVAANDGRFPVDVDRYREELSSGTLSWELWTLGNGAQVFFCNSLVFKKVDPEEGSK